jgi:homoserine kinase
VSAFVTGPVSVEVPATSANLGPGYDCFGLALDLCDELTGEVRASGLEIEVSGAGAEDVPRDEDHLVVRAMRAAFAAMGVEPPGLALRCHNRIPHARGLGSSSAAIVGGIVLARALATEGERLLPDAAALALANRLEGHPDNVAPALLGGFVIAGQSRHDPGGGEVWAEPAPVHPSVSVVAFVPPDGVRTDVARGLLPETVAHADAASNSGRAALLVLALSARPDLLLRATEDYLHQAQREPAMPDSLALVRRLRDAGVPAVISGAGPTVLTFVTGGESERERVASHVPEGWLVFAREVRQNGASVLL